MFILNNLRRPKILPYIVAAPIVTAPITDYGASTNCVLCLSVYNNEVGLPAVLKNIIELQKSGIFTRLLVVVFYEVSRDNSLQLLQDFKQEYDAGGDKGEFVDIFKNLFPPANYWRWLRTERIAYARNVLLTRIREKYGNYPYFIMMDSNDYACVKPIHCDVLGRALTCKADWDALSFDRTDGYYDDWALSYGHFVYSFFHFSNWETAVSAMREDFRMRREKTPLNVLLPVLSAFNGFAIYKTSLFTDCSYSATIRPELFPVGSLETQRRVLGGMTILRNLRGDCEHRAFHLEAIQRHSARIRICLECVF